VTEPFSRPAGGPSEPSGPRADFWYRLGGFLIDWAVLYIVGLLLGQVFRGRFWTSVLVSLAFGIAYSVFFIGSGSGQTPGMRVLGIRAIDARTGGRIDYGTAFVRYLIAIGSGLACYIGYLWMLWDPEKQTWHDKVAKTFVVPTSAFPVERWPG